MSVQQLRDKFNKLLGEIRTKSDGSLEIWDAHNKLKGRYDPRTNLTMDATNHVVAKGNMLTTLL